MPGRGKPFPLLPIRDGAELSWSSFARQRKDKSSQHGYGFRLHFDSPVPVPFAIGSLSHFGLGLFVADSVCKIQVGWSEELYASNKRNSCQK